jgi:N6-L-threonylcarbamoyladenine synthase
LKYPGGPAIAIKAKQLKNKNLKGTIKLPRPMIHSKNYDFSFSGLKTAVLYKHNSTSSKIKKSEKYTEEMASEIQDSINDVLIKKTLSATNRYGAKSIILGGGVTANKDLQNRFKKESKKIQVFFPPGKLQMDNAVMTAIAGFYKKPINFKKIKSLSNLNL